MKMKPFIAATLLMAVMIWPCSFVTAQETATTDEVYELILKAVPVIEELGEEGLAAFNDPKGEFVVKDAYVFVLDCSTLTMAAHPAKQLIGLDLSGDWDKNPDPSKVKQHGREMCSLSKRPNGGWLEYYWNVMGSDEVKRKVGFVIGVPGTPYALVSTIYDDVSNLDELNATLQ